jgi:hypothetical protein
MVIEWWSCQLSHPSVTYEGWNVDFQAWVLHSLLLFYSRWFQADSFSIRTHSSVTKLVPQSSIQVSSWGPGFHSHRSSLSDQPRWRWIWCHARRNKWFPPIYPGTNKPPGLVGEGVVDSPPIPISYSLTWIQAFSNRRGSVLTSTLPKYSLKKVVGKTLHELTRNMGKTWRYMVSNSQNRWIGGYEDVVHYSIAC